VSIKHRRPFPRKRGRGKTLYDGICNEKGCGWDRENMTRPHPAREHAEQYDHHVTLIISRTLTYEGRGN
jgi:hypothetical protein